MSKPRFIGWKEGYRWKVKAEDAYAAIEEVRRQHGGLCDPTLVKAAARDKASPLHPQVFDKNKAEAAEAYYTERAADMLRALVVVYEGRPIDQPERAYQPVVIQESRQDAGQREVRAYLSTEEAMSDPEYRAQIVERALADLVAFQRKYQQLKKYDSRVLPVLRAIEEATSQTATA